MRPAFAYVRNEKDGYRAVARYAGVYFFEDCLRQLHADAVKDKLSLQAWLSEASIENLLRSAEDLLERGKTERAKGNSDAPRWLNNAAMMAECVEDERVGLVMGRVACQ